MKNLSTEKILKLSDFNPFGLNGLLAHRIFVYTISMVKGCTSAKHTFTFFCAVATRIWTLARMGISHNMRGTYAAVNMPC